MTRVRSHKRRCALFRQSSCLMPRMQCTHTSWNAAERGASSGLEEDSPAPAGHTTGQPRRNTRRRSGSAPVPAAAILKHPDCCQACSLERSPPRVLGLPAHEHAADTNTLCSPCCWSLREHSALLPYLAVHCSMPLGRLLLHTRPPCARSLGRPCHGGWCCWRCPRTARRAAAGTVRGAAGLGSCPVAEASPQTPLHSSRKTLRGLRWDLG
jgi:hypothetical protein